MTVTAVPSLGEARLTEAEAVFARVLALNPVDNQGARFCWADVRLGRTWDAVEDTRRS